MGIRQSLNENRSLVTVSSFVILAASVAFAIWYRGQPQLTSYGTREFFTDDDGDTWFVDDGTKIAPFDHNGKQAVMARVFKCGDGKMFVGYLQKFTDEQRKRIEEARKNGQLHSGPARMDATTFSGILLKKPHGGQWVQDNDPAAKEIRKCTCPDGSTDFEPVPP